MNASEDDTVPSVQTSRQSLIGLVKTIALCSSRMFHCPCTECESHACWLCFLQGAIDGGHFQHAASPHAPIALRVLLWVEPCYTTHSAFIVGPWTAGPRSQQECFDRIPQPCSQQYQRRRLSDPQQLHGGTGGHRCKQA